MDRWRPNPEQRRAIAQAAWHQCWLAGERDDASQEALIGIWLSPDANSTTVASRRVVDYGRSTASWHRRATIEMVDEHLDGPEELCSLTQALESLTPRQAQALQAIADCGKTGAARKLGITQARITHIVSAILKRMQGDSHREKP